MAVWMGLLAAAGTELEALLQSIDEHDAVCLDVAHVAVVTPRAQALKRVVMRIELALLQVKSSVAEIGTASDEIASGTQDLSLRTEQTASNLQQATSSCPQPEEPPAGRRQPPHRLFKVWPSAGLP